MSLEAPRARYQQVADDQRKAIKRGEHPPGDMSTELIDLGTGAPPVTCTRTTD